MADNASTSAPNVEDVVSVHATTSGWATPTSRIRHSLQLRMPAWSKSQDMAAVRERHGAFRSGCRQWQYGNAAPAPSVHLRYCNKSSLSRDIKGLLMRPKGQLLPEMRFIKSIYVSIFFLSHGLFIFKKSKKIAAQCCHIASPVSSSYNKSIWVDPEGWVVSPETRAKQTGSDRI